MNLNLRQHKYYDIIISALAVAAVALIIVDYSEGLTGWKLWLNRGIYAVFVTDFVTRLMVARKKRHFIRMNIFDLIALIPFHGIFIFSVTELADQVLRAMSLAKALAFLIRPLKKASRFFETNGFKYVLIATFIMILGGGFLIQYAEGMSFPDGVWWAFVTAATVGYGDISPNTFYGRVIAMILMLVGIGLLGSVTSTLTSFFMEKRRRSVKDSTLAMIEDQLDHFSDLTEQDVEEICAVLKALKTKDLERK